MSVNNLLKGIDNQIKSNQDKNLFHNNNLTISRKMD